MTSSKGTILYYGGFILPDKNAAANRVRANGKLFKEIGYDVYYLGFSDADTTQEISQVPETENAFQMQSPKSTKEWIKHITNPEEFYKLANSTTDLKIIVLYNLPYLTVKKIKNQFSNANIKVIYDCAEWSNYTDGSVIKRLYKKIDCKNIQNKLTQTVDGIIAVSTMIQDKYKRECPTVLLPPIVDLSEETWHQQRYQNDCFTFCFAGFPDGNKENIENIIKAFSSLHVPNIKLVMVGITSEDVTQNNINNVEFKGALPHTESVKHILSCDCFIFLRPDDMRNNAGFPTKFVEAFTSGVSIITTKISDMPLYKNDRVIFCDNCEVDTIREAMKKMVNRKEQKELSNVFDYHNYKDQMCNWMKEIGL